VTALTSFASRFMRLTMLNDLVGTLQDEIRKQIIEEAISKTALELLSFEPSALVDQCQRILDEVVPRLIDAGRQDRAEILLRKAIVVLRGDDPFSERLALIGQSIGEAAKDLVNLATNVGGGVKSSLLYVAVGLVALVLLQRGRS
jgi:hypothetical protein